MAVSSGGKKREIRFRVSLDLNKEDAKRISNEIDMMFNKQMKRSKAVGSESLYRRFMGLKGATATWGYTKNIQKAVNKANKELGSFERITIQADRAQSRLNKTLNRTARSFIENTRQTKQTTKTMERASTATIRLGGRTEGIIRIFSRLRNQLLVVAFALGGLVLTVKEALGEFVALENAVMGLERVATAFGQSAYEAREAAIRLAEDGLMTIAEASAGLKNLLATGFNLPQAIDLMYALKDAAAFNRQGTLALGEAIVGATQGIKNQNCCDSETLVYDPVRNETKTIEEWHDEGIVPAVLSVNRKTGKLKVIQASYLHYNGENEVFKIELENGKEIKVTKNHRFFTDKGVKFTWELSPNDSIQYVEEDEIRTLLITEKEKSALQGTKKDKIFPIEREEACSTNEGNSILQQLKFDATSAENLLNLFDVKSKEILYAISLMNVEIGTDHKMLYVWGVKLLQKLRPFFVNNEEENDELQCVIENLGEITQEIKQKNAIGGTSIIENKRYANEMAFDVYDVILVMKELLRLIICSERGNDPNFSQSYLMESVSIKKTIEKYIKNINNFLKKNWKNTPAYVKIMSISSEGISRTYDLTVPEEHNFVAEGMVQSNSIMVDNAGITKNLSIILKEAGYSMQDLSKVTTDANVRLALYNGILKEAAVFQGDAAKAANTLGGMFSKAKTSSQLLKAQLGEILAPAFKSISAEIIKTNNNIREWIATNEKLLKQQLDTYLKTILITIKALIIALSTLGKIIAIIPTEVQSFLTIFIGIKLVLPIVISLIRALTKAFAGLSVAVSSVTIISAGLALILTRIARTKSEIEVLREKISVQTQEIQTEMEINNKLIQAIELKKEKNRATAKEIKMLKELTEQNKEYNESLFISEIQQNALKLFKEKWVMKNVIYKLPIGHPLSPTYFPGKGIPLTIPEIFKESQPVVSYLNTLLDDETYRNAEKLQNAITSLTNSLKYLKEEDQGILRGIIKQLELWKIMRETGLEKPEEPALPGINEKYIEILNEYIHKHTLLNNELGVLTETISEEDAALYKINRKYVEMIANISTINELAPEQKAEITGIIKEMWNLEKQIDSINRKRKEEEKQTAFLNELLQEVTRTYADYQQKLSGFTSINTLQKQHNLLLSEYATKAKELNLIEDARYKSSIKNLKEYLSLLRKLTKIEQQRERDASYRRLSGMQAEMDIYKGNYSTKEKEAMSQRLSDLQALKEAEAERYQFIEDMRNKNLMGESEAARMEVEITQWAMNRKIEIEAQYWQARHDYLEIFNNAFSSSLDMLTSKLANTTNIAKLQWKDFMNIALDVIESVVLGYFKQKAGEALADAIMYSAKAKAAMAIAAASWWNPPMAAAYASQAAGYTAAASEMYKTAALLGGAAIIGSIGIGALRGGSSGGEAGGGGGVSGAGTTGGGSTITGTVQARELNITIAPVLHLEAGDDIFIGSGSITEFSQEAGNQTVQIIQDAIETGEINLNEIKTG